MLPLTARRSVTRVLPTDLAREAHVQLNEREAVALGLSQLG